MSIPIVLDVQARSLENPEIEHLVQRSRGGDLDAFDRLIALYYPVTYGVAYRMLGHREAAEDAAQEIFVKTWRHLRRFRGDARFATWLYTIAVHHCLDIARKWKRSPACAPPEMEDDEPVADGPGRSAPCWETRLIVQDALARLPDKLRLVVSLHFYADCSIREIADALDVSPTTVQYRLKVALERLGRSLKDQEV